MKNIISRILTSLLLLQGFAAAPALAAVEYLTIKGHYQSLDNNIITIKVGKEFLKLPKARLVDSSAKVGTQVSVNVLPEDVKAASEK